MGRAGDGVHTRRPADRRTRIAFETRTTVVRRAAVFADIVGRGGGRGEAGGGEGGPGGLLGADSERRERELERFREEIDRIFAVESSYVA